MDVLQNKGENNVNMRKTHKWNGMNYFNVLDIKLPEKKDEN
jgi:hypothetical protein